MDQIMVLAMNFGKRLTEIRKGRGLTQQALGELVGMNGVQIHRYESGNTFPTYEGIRKLAVGLNISSDVLLFEKDERGPDDNLRLQFEAISHFAPAEKQLVMEILDSLILKNEAKRWAITQKAKTA